jgi:hypothetical protein
MEFNGDYIVGVHTYCDRWCARCPLAHRCAFSAGEPVEEGTGFESLDRVREWLSVSAEGSSHLPKDMEPGHRGPSPAVVANADRLHRKFRRARFSPDAQVRLAVETIEHFMVLVQLRMLRAFAMVARHGPGGRQSDANGCGKVALLGLERMSAAWKTLVGKSHLTNSDAAPFLEEIARMERNLHRALPNAREFVRPGLDELDEVRMLDATRLH